LPGLLALGLEIHEYMPAPDIQLQLMPRADAAKRPTFAIHAKSMVFDSKAAFIGTYNLDPRSENLNTEVGAIIHDEQLARTLERSIEADMQPGNNWNAARDDPDRYASLLKRGHVRLWQLAPIKPLL